MCLVFDFRAGVTLSLEPYDSATAGWMLVHKDALTEVIDELRSEFANLRFPAPTAAPSWIDDALRFRPSPEGRRAADELATALSRNVVARFHTDVGAVVRRRIGAREDDFLGFL